MGERTGVLDQQLQQAEGRPMGDDVRDIERTRVRLAVKWEPRDLWVGIYWNRGRFWGGFSDAYTASASNAPPEMAENRDAYAHRWWRVYLCILPLLPIVLHVERCPAPDVCTSGGCPVGRENQQAREGASDG